MTTRLLHDMTAAERLAHYLPAIAGRYGEAHPYTKAARAGDIARFRSLTRNVSEWLDPIIVSIVDARDGPVVKYRPNGPYAVACDCCGVMVEPHVRQPWPGGCAGSTLVYRCGACGFRRQIDLADEDDDTGAE